MEGGWCVREKESEEVRTGGEEYSNGTSEEH